jgi:hypothetical protein
MIYKIISNNTMNFIIKNNNKYNEKLTIIVG